MNVEQLLKLLGPTRVTSAQRTGDTLLLTPPVQDTVVRVRRERFTRLSTEHAWIFTATTACDTKLEGTVIAEQKGFLKKKLSLTCQPPESAKLGEVLVNILSKDLGELLRKAKPERVAVDVRESMVHVQIVKTLTGPLATPLLHCFDLSWKLATTISEILSERK